VRRLLLHEWQEATVELTPETATTLATSDSFEIRPDRAPGHWRVRATRHVGVALIGESLELRVEPKVGVRRLVELLGISRERVRWDLDADPDLGISPDLAGVVAAALAAQVGVLTARGLLQGYRRIDEARPTVKGRIRVGAQMARRSGLPLPVELRYDQLTIDIAENRLLAGAVEALLRLPSLPTSIRTRLRRLRHALIEVTPTPPSREIPVPTRTRLNQHYWPAVDLALLVLRSCSLDETVGDQRGTGFLVDMDKVFEDVVTLGLGDRLRRQDLYVTGQDSHPLDRDRRLSIQPDIVVRNAGGQVVDVLDVKYKLPTQRSITNADVYQVVVYAQRFGLDQVHLVYPEAPPWPELHVNGVTIHLCSVDLLDETAGLDRLTTHLTFER